METEARVRTIENEEQTRELLKLYGFDDTAINTLLALQPKPRPQLKHSEVWLPAVKTEKIFLNNRGTLKLIVFHDKSYALVSKNARAADIPLCYREYDRLWLLWDAIKEGDYVLIFQAWRGEVLSLNTKCKSEEELQEWMKLYKECYDLQSYRRTYHDLVLHRLDSAVVTKEMLQELKEKQQAEVEKAQEFERQEQLKKQKALDSIVVDSDTVVFTALDGNKYYLSKKGGVAFTKEAFLEYTYAPRYYAGGYDYILPRLLNHMLDRYSEFKLSINDKPPVTVETKTIRCKNGLEVKLTYANNVKVGAQELPQVLKEYFFEDKPITAKKRHAWNSDRIINGMLVDEEGSFQVTLTFGKRGLTWYLTVSGDEYEVSGGLAVIESLERILTGHTNEHRRRYSTEEFYRRLSKAIGKERALKVVEEVKTIGLLNSKLLNGQSISLVRIN